MGGCLRIRHHAQPPMGWLYRLVTSPVYIAVQVAQE